MGGHTNGPVRFVIALFLCILWNCSAAAQTLTVTNNLQLWLKADSVAQADGTPVGFWMDSSGNTNHATQATVANQPTYLTNAIRGRPALLFDGTSDFLSLTNKLDSNYSNLPRLKLLSGLTMFAVFRTFSADTTRGFVSNPAQTIIGDDTGAAYVQFGLHGAKAEYNHYVTSWTNYVDGTTLLNHTNGMPAHSITVTHRSSDGLVNLYADGKLEATATRPYQTVYTAINRISGGYPGADLFDGLIAEVIVYSGELSSADRMAVQDYLNFKYAIPEPVSGVLCLLGLAPLIRRTRS